MSEEPQKDEVQESPRAFFVAAAVTLVLLVLCEVMFRDTSLDDKIRKSSISNLTVKAADYDKLGGDIVITGDSRMFHGVVPSAMHDALKEVTGKDYSLYNFGIPSGTTPIFYLVAHQAAHHRTPPKVFVLGITPALFSCCDNVSSPGIADALVPGDIPGLVRAFWWASPEEAGSSVVLGLSHLASTRSEAINAVRDLTQFQPLTFQDRGWISQGGRIDAATQDVRAKGRAKGYADLMDKSKGATLHPVPPRLVREAIRELKAAGTKVVVIGTPQARQLDWYHDRAHTYFEYIDAVKKVTSEEGVLFVDCNAPPGIENTDFKDGDHLSEPGAITFTRYLAKDVVAPQLQ